METSKIKLKDHETHDAETNSILKKRKENGIEIENDRISSQSEGDIPQNNPLLLLERPQQRMLLNTFQIKQQKQGYVQNPIDISDSEVGGQGRRGYKKYSSINESSSDTSGYSSGPSSRLHQRINRRRETSDTVDNNGTSHDTENEQKRRKKYRKSHHQRSLSPFKTTSYHQKKSHYKKRKKSPHNQKKKTHYQKKKTHRRSKSPRYRSNSPYQRGKSPHFDQEVFTSIPALVTEKLEVPFNGKGKVFTFWDYENIFPMRGVGPFMWQMKRFSETIDHFGYVSCFRAYIQHPIPLRYSEILQVNGIQLIKSPTHRKEAADKCLITDVCMEVAKNGVDQSIVIIISDDGDFMYLMRRLKQMGCHVIWIGSKAHSVRYFHQSAPSTCFSLVNDFFQIPSSLLSSL